MLIKCIGLVLCGIGIGTTLAWRIMYRPKPMTEREARRRAEKLYNHLLEGDCL